MKKLYDILIGCLLVLTLLLSACNSNDTDIVVFQPDFFCDEDKPDVFFSFEIDGEDVFVANGTLISIDLCNLSTEISSAHNLEAIVNDLFIISGTRVNIVSREYDINFDLIGALYENEVDLSVNRSYGDQILRNDFQYRKVEGTLQFDDGNLGLEIPDNRPSYTAIELRAKTDNQIVRYKTDAPVVLDEFPYFLPEFQNGSFMEIESVEEIDYKSADFSGVQYNYIITGKFACRIYREGSSEKFLDIKNGRFRIPVYFRNTSEVF